MEQLVLKNHTSSMNALTGSTAHSIILKHEVACIVFKMFGKHYFDSFPNNKPGIYFPIGFHLIRDERDPTSAAK